MAGLFGSTTIPGNRITDFTAQTASVGNPIPFGYGRFPVDGNVIWTAGIPTEHVTKKKQGKGGVKTEEYTYTLSYAISFCAGPIFGFLTISRNGKIVYTTDPSASVDDKAFAAKWKQKATFYYGDRVQMPDSTIEAKEGAGKVSAFRDLCYIVVEDDDVTDGGGAVPQYEAVVIASPPEVYMTSRPYPRLIEDSMKVGIIPQSGALNLVYFNYVQNPDFVKVGVAPMSGQLRSQLQAYSNPIENVKIGTTPQSGTLRSILHTYSVAIEPISVGVAPQSGTLVTVLIKYTNPIENIGVGVTPRSGTLSP